MRCEDFPACGHELGCCPDFGASGRQLNMKCTCGATLPIDNRYSICNTCLRSDDDEGYDFDRDFGYDDEHDPGDLKEHEDFAHDNDFDNYEYDGGDFWGD